MTRIDRLNRLIRDGETHEGFWELSRGHQVRYRRRGPEEEVLLSGDLVSAEARSLTFRLRQAARDGDTQRRELSLRGRWLADGDRRLGFLVEREQGPQEKLTLQGEWELSPQNEVLYRFERARPGKKGKSVHLLRFEGYWEVGEDRKLAYVLDADSDSAFRFRGSFQTFSILEKRGALRYQLGAAADGRRGRLKTVTLFGKWKLSRDLSLEFEVPYSDGFSRSMTFGASYSLDRKTQISARLTTSGGGPLGLEVGLHREFLAGNGQAFLRLRRSLEETAAEAGVKVLW